MMHADQKRELLATLESGRQAYLESIHGLSEEDARRSLGPGRWSVLEIAEHLALVETLLLKRIASAQPMGSRPEVQIDPKREDLIRERAPNRSRAIPAPEPVVPTGRFPTFAAALETFGETRANTIRFVENCDYDLRTRIADHPVLGPANCYEMLLMIAFHPKRHSGQIAEIRAGLVENKTGSQVAS